MAMRVLGQLTGRRPALPRRHRLSHRRLFARRRLIAALLASLAVACVLTSIEPPGGVEVLAAARDLPGGRLSASDVMVVRLPPGAVPDGVFRPGSSVTGRVVAGPMRRGEPLTDARVLGHGMLATQGPGIVATPVRIADPAVAELLSPGDVVDVLAAFEGNAFDRVAVEQEALEEAAPDEGRARQALTVARQVRVMTRPSVGEGGEGVLLVLATTPGQAAQLAQAQAHGRLSVTIHPR